MPFLSTGIVLWLVLWSMALFVVAPHLDTICRPAARSVRLGSLALLVDFALSVAVPFVRLDVVYEVHPVVDSATHALFWGSMAFAALQLLRTAPAPKELR